MGRKVARKTRYYRNDWENTTADKVVAPLIVPKEPSDTHQDIGNQIPGVEVEDNLNSIMDSNMSPMVIHHNHTEECDDEFESVQYIHIR